MKQIAIISTSYPTEQDGSEAAGSFVADFAATLSEKRQVTFIELGLTPFFSRASGINTGVIDLPFFFI